MNLGEELKQEFSDDSDNAISHTDVLEGATAKIRFLML